MRRKFISVAMLCACAFFGTVRIAGAQDDMQAVGAVWSDFVDSLRKGAYGNAHALFSPGSRAAMPYAEFVAEYSPLSAAREMVLVKPESLGTTLDGDWAEITYGGTTPGTGEKFRVGVALVRNRGAWGLVAARNETAEHAEAGARNLLALIWEARDRGTPKELVAALNAAHAKDPVLQFYRMETDGRIVRAFPLRQNLRTFFLDGTGAIHAMGEPDQPAAAKSTQPEPPTLQIPQRSVLPHEAPPVRETPAPTVLENGMPELSEPPPRGGRKPRANIEREIAEPSPRNPRSRPQEQPNISLPDTIR